VFNGYGMTETAALITALTHDDAVEHADSVGYAVPSVDLAIAPKDDDPTLGELVVRGAKRDQRLLATARDDCRDDHRRVAAHR
jgi:long-subunit acyl-CoA synthetase (AMP-forming)